jgi:hypothetical protein
MWRVLPQYVFTTQETIQAESLNLSQIHMRMLYNVSRWWDKFVKNIYEYLVKLHVTKKTPRRIALFHTLLFLQLVKKLPSLTRRLIALFSQHPASCACLKGKSRPRVPILLLRFIYISSHLHLGLPSGLCSSCFLANILHVFVVSVMRATHHANLSSPDTVSLIKAGEEHKSLSSS